MGSLKEGQRPLQEGDLVLIIGKLDERIRKRSEDVVMGTFLGFLDKKRIWVLLPDGNIFYGAEYEIVAEAPVADADPQEETYEEKI